uniref:Growth arrest-specific 1 n=2 Tax=Callorhinchus milii TaxID=7868 RepID=V9L834_CALMI
MASLAGLIRNWGLLLACLLGFLNNSGPVLARWICWQAIMQCQVEPECSYAYNQYLQACRSVLYQETRRCPSHCISALIHLNDTQTGPMLESCDCVQDEICKSTKRAIEPCLPRTRNRDGVMGCTEARQQCERDPQCHNSMRRYLHNCGKLFNGVKCTDQCREVIESMLSIPKALLLKECVCDGADRPICEAVKDNMARLCFSGAEHSSGSSGWDMEPDDEYQDYYDTQSIGGDAGGQFRNPSGPKDSCSPRAPSALTLTVSMFLLLLVSRS